MNKEQAIALAESADLKSDWIYDIIDQLENRFAAGYITCRMEALNECISSVSEDFREEIIEALQSGIWKNKP